MWFWLVILAYLLNAGATLISKRLLITTIPHPVVFVFYIGVLNLLALVLIPFGFYIPNNFEIFIALLSGATYAAAMYYLAKALHIDQASQVAPMIGGLQPIFVLAFAWWFLPDELIAKQYLGIFLLVVGSILMALEIGKKRIFTESFKYILVSTVLFGLSYATLKLVYLQQNFTSGFVWTRFGTFLFVIFLILLPNNWAKVRSNFKKSGEKVKTLFVVGQILGAVSFLLVAYAISLGPVTIINALQGIQYAVLFIIILLLAKKYPQLLDEPLQRSIVIQKTVAILILILGLALVI